MYVNLTCVNSLTYGTKNETAVALNTTTSPGRRSAFFRNRVYRPPRWKTSQKQPGLSSGLSVKASVMSAISDDFCSQYVIFTSCSTVRVYPGNKHLLCGPGQYRADCHHQSHGKRGIILQPGNRQACQCPHTKL